MFLKALRVQDDDKEKLLLELKKKQPHIVGVDGEDGAGKSTKIAPFLAEQLNGTVLSIDNYLEKDRGSYIGYLHYESLCRDLLALVKKSWPIIIEGIMLLDVLKKIGMSQDYLIYACSSMWYDDWTGEYENHYKRGTLEEIIKHEESITKIISAKYKMEGMRKELYTYTYKQQPFYKANAIWISRSNKI